MPRIVMRAPRGMDAGCELCLFLSDSSGSSECLRGANRCRGGLLAMLNPGNAPGRWGHFAPFLRGKPHGPEAIEGRFPQQCELSQFCPGWWGGAVVSPGDGQCVFLCLGQWAGSIELIVTPREVGTLAEGKWDRAKDLSGGVQTEHPDLSDGGTERPNALRPELALGKALRAPWRARSGSGSPGKSECLLSGLDFFPRWVGGPGDSWKAPPAVSPGGHTGCGSVAGWGRGSEGANGAFRS